MKKLNENQKKFLGTVPKKCQLVETFWDCPEISKTRNKGITLIALIITIIVMLILVGVTINVAMNGGLFTKAEEASFKTNIAQIKEALAMERAVVLAEASGENPDYSTITMDKLNISQELKTKYGTKLIIGADGNLYYNENALTADEKTKIEAEGIKDSTNAPSISSDNKRYFISDIDGNEAVFIYNGVDDFTVYMKEDGKFVSVGAGSDEGLIKLNKTAIVKFNDTEELEFDVVMVEKREESEYRDDDLIIDGKHYGYGNIILMSANMLLRDPSNKTVTYNEDDGKIHVDIEHSITEEDVGTSFEGDKTQFN